MRKHWYITGLCAGLACGFAFAPYVAKAFGPFGGFTISFVFGVLCVARAHTKER